MYWSQDGWNFDIAGDSGYQTLALTIGWVLAISVTVIEFVFSSNYVELNESLLFFGILAYGYSIYTNAQGIMHFQGTHPNTVGAWILGFVMDGVPEPLIAWGLYESRSGNFIGNLVKMVVGMPKKIQEQNQTKIEKRESAFRQEVRPMFPNQPKKGQGRGFQESHRVERGNYTKHSDTKPNPFGKFEE